MSAAEIAQSFDRDIDSDLVAVLETVGDRLGRRLVRDRYSLDAVGLDPLGESGPGEAHHPEPRVVEPRLATFLGQGDPHLGRELCRQLVKAQGREETDHTTWDPLGDLGKRVVGGAGVIARGVDPASLPLHLPLLQQRIQSPARDALFLEVGRSHDPEPTDDGECSTFVGRHDAASIQNVGTYAQLPTLWSARSQLAALGPALRSSLAV
jgi:hypothetical protein